MPAHPTEENAHQAGHSSITDNTQSTASTHEGHQSAKATAEDHKAAPGPAIPEKMGDFEKKSKEELRARAAELNKD
ncbi:MAG: hypothetical protein M1824_005778 [Vezdaea acicularis]|nr:MAG: hypothetical protein M1824_005778 [Vezdaea acicularis]